MSEILREVRMESGVPRKALRRRKQGGFYIFDVPRNQTYFYQHGQRQRIIRLQLVSILQGLARHSKIARGQSCGGDSVKFIVRANVFRSRAARRMSIRADENSHRRESPVLQGSFDHLISAAASFPQPLVRPRLEPSQVGLRRPKILLYKNLSWRHFYFALTKS